MEGSAEPGFERLSDAEIGDYAASASTAPPIPPEYLAAVIDNLRGLRDHARIVAGALAAAGATAGDPAEAFEP